MTFSIIIPVYNSSISLIELNKRIVQVFESLNYDYEIIFVDDGSVNPATSQALKEIKGSHHNIAIIKFDRNYGQHSAILCGLSYSKGDYLIIMDDDGQHQPEEIPKLLDKCGCLESSFQSRSLGTGEKSGYDVVIGKFDLKYHSFIKKLGSSLKRFLEIKLFDRRKDIYLTTFLLMKREIADKIISIQGEKPLLGSYIYHVTNNIANILVEHSQRMSGDTGYTLVKQIRLFYRLFYNYFRLKKLNKNLNINTQKVLPFRIKEIF